jgi:alkylation response protein AidB-like acyl-CoA dehydrogenase
MVDPAMLKGMNVEVFGEGNPFSDPSWYQAYNSPYYNDTHKMVRKIYREFTDEHLMENVHDWDEDGKIPEEVYEAAGKIGAMALCVGRPWPEQYVGKCPWGFEPDYFHELVMYDEISRTGSGGFLWGIAGGTTIGLPPIYNHGSDAVKAKVVPAALRGEVSCCLCITEPSAGSDVANLKTSAKLEGDHYILNGEKKWITNGIFAKYFTVACRTGEAGMNGISLLMVESDMPGVTTRKMKCSGVWSSGTTYITFDDVKVPKGNLLGKENSGFKYIMENFNHERFGICAMTNRFSRVCLEESLKFATKRKTFGKTLVQHPVIRWKIAEMARLIEATHAWLEWATYQMNTMGKMEANLKLGGHTALLKVQCTKVFEYCAREGAQIFGGLGYTRGGQGEKVERLNREVRAMAVPGGSEEVMLDLGVRQTTKLAQMAKMLSNSMSEASGDTTAAKAKL